MKTKIQSILILLFFITLNTASFSQSVEIDGELKINVVAEDSTMASNVLMLSPSGTIGKRDANDIGGLPASSIVFSAIQNNPTLLSAGYVQIGSQSNQYTRSGSGSSSYGIWNPINNTPTARFGHHAFWTGTEMLIYGGLTNGNVISNTGAKYDPVSDTWTPISTTNAPVPANTNNAVWTGTEMIVWGGLDATNQYITQGHKYNPTSDTWTAISTTNAPSGRFGFGAVWTGTEMIVWGGIGQTGRQKSGKRYNPTTDTWTTMLDITAPDARNIPEMIWTGTEMIVWGGLDAGGVCYNTGGKYIRVTDGLTALSTNNAPDGRAYHSLVWTGTEMLVWGGALGSSAGNAVLNTGGKYDPVTDSWTTTNTADAPSARYYHSTVWTGSEMIVWSGSETPTTSIMTDTGGIYDPATDSWNDTSLTDAPIPRVRHTGVWTGTEMIVWGGFDATSILSSGGTFDLSGTVLYLYMKN